MSVSIAFTGNKDKDKNIAAYKRQLGVRSELNKKYETAAEERAYTTKYDIPQPPAPFSSAEDELNDEVSQREKAVATIRSFMKPGDVVQAFSYLREANEIPIFNMFSGPFMEFIKGQSNFTVNTFRGLWTKFKEDYSFKQDILREATASRATLGNIDTSNQNILNEFKALEAAISSLPVGSPAGYSAPMGASPPMATPPAPFAPSGAPVPPPPPPPPPMGSPTLLSPKASEVKMDPDELNREKAALKSSLTPMIAEYQADYTKIMKKVNELVSARRDKDSITIEESKDGSISIKNTEGIKTDADLAVLYQALSSGNYIKTFNSNRGATLLRGSIEKYKPTSQFGKDLKSSLLEGLKTSNVNKQKAGDNELRQNIYKNALYKAFKPQGGIDGNQVDAALKKRRDKMAADEAAAGKGFRIQKKKRQLFMKGKGLFDLEEQIKKGEKVLKEKKKPSTEYNAPLGRRAINIPCLVKGYLSVRTSGGSYLTGRPMYLISDQLRTLIFKLLEEKGFTEEEYDALSEGDQKIFDDLICSSRFAGSGVATHIKYSDKERREMLNRFEVLKGELLAGNNASELVKEMRNIVMKLRKQRFISKQDYENLLTDILACI